MAQKKRPVIASDGSFWQYVVSAEVVIFEDEEIKIYVDKGQVGDPVTPELAKEFVDSHLII